MRIIVVFLLFFSVMYSLEIYIDRVEENIQNRSIDFNNSSYEDVVNSPHPVKL